VAIDIAADARAAEQFDVIRSSKQSDVIDLRDTGREELDGAGDQVFVVTSAEGIVKGAIDLVEIEIARGGSGCLAARALAALVNGFDERVDLVARQKTGKFNVFVSRWADIEHADSIMCVEYGYGIARGNFEPALQVSRIAAIERVQHERRQREIVDPVALPRDFDLVLIMCVDLDQNLGPPRVGLRSEFRDEVERFANHEATGAGFLDGVTDGVEADDPNTGAVELVKNEREVLATRGMVNVDVNLFGSKGGPEKVFDSVCETRLCKWQAGTWAIDSEQIGLVHSAGEDAAQRQ